MPKHNSTNTLSIVTDASAKVFTSRAHPKGRWFSCYGALAIDEQIETYQIAHDCPNNRGELLGVKLGITMAKDIMETFPGKYEKVVIYSDSKLAVSGLKSWMGTWISKMINGVMYKSDGSIVKNQDLYVDIMSFLSTYKFHIHLKHIAAHINTSSLSDLEKAKADYRISNDSEMLSRDELVRMCDFNNMVDRGCKAHLDSLGDPDRYPMIDYINHNYIDMVRYAFPYDYAQYIH